MTRIMIGITRSILMLVGNIGLVDSMMTNHQGTLPPNNVVIIVFILYFIALYPFEISEGKRKKEILN